MTAMRALTALVVCASVGCGAGSSLEILDPNVPTDAGCDPDGDGSAAHGDAIAGDAHAMPDALLFDHGTNGPNADAALPRCMSNEDCDGWATCQSGLCCSGVMVGTTCTCGEGAGCDLRSACCVPFSSATRKLECVADCEATCGCTAR